MKTLFNISPNRHGYVKNFIAILIAIFSVGITVAITWSSLINDETEVITSTILPLVGTWMGAILAYYFSKENFDAAAAQYNKVIDKLTPEKKLKSIKVVDVMIPFNRIVWSEIIDCKQKFIVGDILSNSQYKGFNRFLFFDKKRCSYIIHRSTFDRFITLHLLSNTNIDFNKLMLSDLLATTDDIIKGYLQDGVKYIPESSTLWDAKILIDQNPQCGDIIITKNGGANEDVLGWLTDVEISKNSEN